MIVILVDSTPSDGSETFVLPSNISSNARSQIIISSLINPSLFDLSDTYLALVQSNCWAKNLT
jgi:hypothetical protein